MSEVYEFIAMVKTKVDDSWVTVGQARNQSINDVAGLIQCTDHEHFSYACRDCLENRSFLKQLQVTETATRVQRDEHYGWRMEIAHVSGLEYMA